MRRTTPLTNKCIFNMQLSVTITNCYSGKAYSGSCYGSNDYYYLYFYSNCRSYSRLNSYF